MKYRPKKKLKEGKNEKQFELNKKKVWQGQETAAMKLTGNHIRDFCEQV